MDNLVVKIILPKMNYEKHERIEVIRQAYKGLFQLASRGLFDKYVDFSGVIPPTWPHEDIRDGSH